MLEKFLADQGGATTIEYGLVAGLMLVVVVGIASTGEALSGLYERVGLVSEALDGSVSTPVDTIESTPPG